MSPLFTVIVFTEISVYKLGMGISFSISEEWQYEIELLKIKTSVGNRKKQKKKATVSEHSIYRDPRHPGSVNSTTSKPNFPRTRTGKCNREKSP